MKFKDFQIHSSIKNQLDVLGFKRPTDIQFKAIKHILDGEDVMAVAPTGTGKTAAFIIPMLHRLLSKTPKMKGGVRSLVLVPTRELASQITMAAQQIAALTPLKIVGIYGGVEQDQQIADLKKVTDILVGTPGRIFDLQAQGFIHLENLEILVLDEADLMLDLGFNKDVKDLVKRIPKNRQTLFFTATISKKIKALAYDIVRDAIRIQISPNNPVSKNVSHAVLFCEMDDKRFFLENLIKENEELKMIVFARTKVRVERIVAAMTRVDVSAEALHGGMDQTERFAILNRFRSGENKILITTDVACRGIDIPNMDFVVNYDLPENPENYVHRCGRTGRGTNKGQALSFCSADEEKLLEDIEEYTGEEVERYTLTPNEYQQILQDSDDLHFENGDYNWKKLLKDFDNPDRWDDK
jgi:ATP-dependent RNA helicase RhlE